jgi:hypothetical protein
MGGGTGGGCINAGCALQANLRAMCVDGAACVWKSMLMLLICYSKMLGGVSCMLLCIGWQVC